MVLKAKVIVSMGQIVDIVLIESGSGYTEAPKIVVARKYDLLKKEILERLIVL